MKQNLLFRSFSYCTLAACSLVACGDDTTASHHNFGGQNARSSAPTAVSPNEPHVQYEHYQTDLAPAQLPAIAPAQITFDDVAGASEAKRALQEFVNVVNDLDLNVAQGINPSAGILLVGAPGTGKTLLARATAHAVNASFYPTSGSVLSEVSGSKTPIERLRTLFEQARDNAPAIIFIDELDALKDYFGTSKQLGLEMDGFSGRDGVFVIAACNSQNVLDPSLLRPGRFDRIIEVPLPDLAARRAILALRTQGKSIFAGIDLDAIAANTQGMSGASLVALTNTAALRARQANRQATLMVDFEEAQDDLEIGPVTHAERVNLDDLRRIAVHESGHAAVALLTGETPYRLRRVTVVPRGDTGGHTRFFSDGDSMMLTPTQLRDRIAVALGAFAAETLTYGEAARGVSSDLRGATDLARQMVTLYGMHEAIGPVAVAELSTPQMYRGWDAGNLLTDEVNSAVRHIINQQYERAKELLRNNEDKLKNLTDALVECSALTRAQAYEAFFQGTHIDCRDLMGANTRP